ncbi:hypothetical protein SISSUDRAFT_1128650 [Sistotremastrum suecicum HHB10207 ss-3]|uniref:BRCT domain-containing protein n=1 Tax=Sistotremastrum suecicum HHB10207 ss-3 TaxID=1314776 RepID=A0A166DLU4_9AGAM|nr:hypothetical protein SISSUDRAFT_1128650 [Sistotremastrum suecicum HHB10207 ss-3]
MWVVTAAFDATESHDDVNRFKTKLLKCGQKFTLGRKAKADNENHLIIRNPKVSNESGYFKVFEQTEDDVRDVTKVPRLEFHNTKKPLTVHRHDQLLAVQANSVFKFESGDKLNVVSSVPMIFEWRPICIYASVKEVQDQIPASICAVMGLKVVYAPEPSITHHITETLTLSPPIVDALVTPASLVTPSWIHELLRRGQLPDNLSPTGEHSLFDEFALPRESDYIPTPSPSLPAELQLWKTADRKSILKGISVTLLDEQVNTRIMFSLLEKVGAKPSCCDIYHSLKDNAWNKHLASARRKADDRASEVGLGNGWKGPLICVADVEKMKKIARDKWKIFEEGVKGLNLQFIHPDLLLKAIVLNDASLIQANMSPASPASAPTPSSSEPSQIPSTYPEESSIPSPKPASPPPAPKPRLTRRSGSASAEPAAKPTPAPVVPPTQTLRSSVPPSDNEASSSTAKLPPRRALTRRAKAAAVDILDSDSDSDSPGISNFTAPVVPPPSTPAPTPIIPSTAATPGRPRLKRRAQSQLPDSSQTVVPPDVDEDRPTKRLRGLFEEADPDRVASQLESSQFDAPQPSQLPRTRQPSNTNANTATLQRIVEDEEAMDDDVPQSQSLGKRTTADRSFDSTNQASSDAPPPPSKKKRTAATSQDVPSPTIEPPPPTATLVASEEQPSATLSSATTTTQARPTPHGTIGATHGEPDKDVTFLKAIASTKKGKRGEDNFDREFNNLRISKPDLRLEERAREMAAVDDMLIDRGIRGNFMVVVEMQVNEHGRENGVVRKAGAGMKPEWVGKPDFKKFKKKVPPHHGSRVPLVASESLDGVGDSYWPKNTQSQSQAPRLKKEPSEFELLESQEDLLPSGPLRSKSRSTSLKPSTTNPPKTAKSTLTQRSKGLFLAGSDGEDDQDTMDAIMDDPLPKEEPMEEDEPTPPPKAKKPTRKKVATKAPLMDDDDDDGLTFGGFGGRKRTKR